MAATFTEVTLEDMEKFLRRAYNVFRPKKGESRGEVYYDLNVSKGNIFVRIWTSIRPSSGTGADKGQDAIRVTLVTKGGKPLVPKGTIVKRTQNWRTSLQNRIDELLDDYEAKKDYWKGRQQERDSEATPPVVETTPPAPTGRPSGNAHEGRFVRLRDGETWGAFITTQGAAGDSAILETKGGKRMRVTLREKEWAGTDRYTRRYAEHWTFSTNKSASEESPEEESTAARVAERYMASMV